MNAVLDLGQRLESRPLPSWPQKSIDGPSMGEPCQYARCARLQESDRRLCEQLALQYNDRMLAVARRILGSEDAAADAIQDAFLSVFNSLHRFQAKSQLSTWFHRIVVNCCLMKLRSQKRRQMISLDTIAPICGETTPANQTSEFDRCDVIARLEQADRKALIHRCIDELSDNHRTILVLRDLQELDTDTTARLLGISRTAAKTRLHRARQALRVLLESSAVNVAQSA